MLMFLAMLTFSVGIDVVNVVVAVVDSVVADDDVYVVVSVGVVVGSY